MIVDEGHVRIAFLRDVPEARYEPTDTASASLQVRSRRSPETPRPRPVPASSAATSSPDCRASSPARSSPPELAFQLAVRMLVETLRLGADADDNTVEAALRALVGRLD